MTEVALEGIRKSFAPPAAVLRGIDLRVAPGECFALLGSSGCGKTTLLRILAGLEQSDAGRVLMDGRDVTALPPERRPTALVFQNYALFPHLTVAGNVAFGLRLRRRTKAEIERKVAEVLELVHLTGLGPRRIDELSGGQQQRVALARVLAVEPKVLLLDEPLSNLDAMLRRATRSAIREVQTALGLTTVYITHDQEEALAVSDRLAVMDAGRIVQSGAPRELFERPATVEVARFLGQRSVVAATVRGRQGSVCTLVAGEQNEAVLQVDCGATPVDSGAVWLALLPRDVLLARDGEGWPAEVTVVSFAGTETSVEVRLIETGETVRVAFDPAATPDLPLRGDRVLVRVRPGAGLVYRR